MRYRPLRLAVIASVLVLLAAACGQKDDVAVSAGGPAGGGFTDGGAGFEPAPATDGDLGGDAGTTTGEVPGATTGDATTGGATTGGATTAGATTGGATTGTATTGGTTGGATTGGPAPTAAAGPGDRTGITGKTIKIGIHAPVTGAAPFPQNSFQDGKDTYWKYVKDAGGFMGGYNVEVVFQDDKFDPNSAVRACKQMVEADKVFLLVGGGGADQITACAKYANSVGVPYMSAGVNEEGITGLRAYFALSMTYSQQSPLLAQMAAKQFAGKKVGIVVADTPSFNDAYVSFQQAAADNGLNVVHKSKINKSASQSEALSKANELRTAGAEVVYFLSAPTVFINVAQAGAGQAYLPQYIGPGIVNGLNAVATAGCPGIGSARYFSPFPQLDAIGAMDPAYQASYQKYAGKAGDDIGIALWGLNKILRVMFEATGPEISRQSFVATLESGKVFESGVFPPIQFSPRNHFGGQSVHVLQADCNARQYKTIARFVRSF